MSELSPSSENREMSQENMHSPSVPTPNDSEEESSGDDSVKPGSEMWDNFTDGQLLLRKKLAEMIVMDGYPFKFVESPAFVNLMATIQPQFKVPSRWTVARDIYQMYLDEKVKLCEFFKTSGLSVCITTDMWTSEQEEDYMCITAQYLDKDWNLHKKIISFCIVDSHNGEEMGGWIDDCLREWGIARVFAVTLDNASANDTCINYLKERLTSRGCDVVKGEHLHMRCITHVVNLIVGDGLEVVNLSIKRVRDAVSLMMHSSGRLAGFKECCQDESVDSKSLLSLDVPTRWNSTYHMLRAALKFEKAFERFDVKDPSFKLDLTDGMPTPSDWEVVKKMIDILVVFYELTLRVSAPLHVTSHLIYHEIDTLGYLLREWVQSENADIKEMVVKMQLTYDKYWGDPKRMNKLIYLAVVIDPRYKFEFISYYLKDEYGEELGSKLAFDLRSVLDDLFEHYRLVHHSQSESGLLIQEQNEEPSQPFPKKPRYVRSDKYKSHMAQSEDGGIKNDLEIYLTEGVLNGEKEDFNILKWWEMHQCRFPILSHLARDILSMPTSTVPLEFAFSIEGRVLDRFRSSLSPTFVEALVCTQDWLLNPSKQSTTIEEHLASLDIHEDFASLEIHEEDVDMEAEE